MMEYMIPLLLGDPDAGGLMLLDLFVVGSAITEFTDKPAIDDDGDALNASIREVGERVITDLDWVTRADNVTRYTGQLIAQGEREITDMLAATARCAIVVARERREKTE
jgi:hypothetical protein